jgi:mono/diheme cytochrome c family protein
MKRVICALVAVTALTALGCSEKKESSAAEPRQAAPGAGTEKTTDLAALQAGAAEIVGAACTDCHGGPLTPGKLSLEAETLVEATVGVTSAQIDSLALISPGKPERSYLFMKIAGDRRIEGGPMPKGAEPLFDSQIELVRSWIVALAAAPADSAAPADTAAADTAAVRSL